VLTFASFKNFPRLETPQLILNEIKAEDLQEYFKIYSDVEVMRGWGTAKHESIAETRDLIHQHQSNYESGVALRWGIYEKATGRLVGDAGFWRFVPVRSRGELGAKLAKELWGKSLMVEALNAVIAFAYQDLKLHSIEGNLDPENQKSLKFVEKLGFVREGYVREHMDAPKEKIYKDTILFSLLEKDWKASRAYQQYIGENRK